MKPEIKAGLNKSNMNYIERTSSNTDFHTGLFGVLKPTSFYELQVESTYSNKGSKEKYYIFNNYHQDVIINENDTSYLDLDYLPTSIVSKFFLVKNLDINFLIGPSIEIS